MRTITCILLMIAITGCTADDPGPSMPLPKGSPDEPAPVAMTARNDKMVVTNYWAEDGVMEVSIGTGPSKLGWSIRQEDGEVCRILVSDVELARKLIEIAKKRFPELRTGDVWEASPRYFRAGSDVWRTLVQSGVRIVYEKTMKSILGPVIIGEEGNQITVNWMRLEMVWWIPE